MAPIKKYRGVNMRLLNSNKVSPDRDVKNSTKSRKRKRKMSDMLGSQWSKEELECFYEAYRKYGKDWKKVAGVVRNRSVEMVEALYNMNQAYLSLPEGIATVVGLIAMMADHYSVLEGSDNGSNGASDTSQKSQKPGRGKVQLSASKIMFQPPSVANDGCLSLLKSLSDGISPHAVGKRTPRFLVSYSYKKDHESHSSLNKVNLKSDLDVNDDEVAQMAAITLTEASQREGSRAPQATFRRTEYTKASAAHSWEKIASQMPKTKICCVGADEDQFEGNLERVGAENGDNAGDTCSLVDLKCVGTVLQKEKFYDNQTVEEFRNNHFDDCQKACCGTEVHNTNPVKRKFDTVVTKAKIGQSQKKRSKKLFFGEKSPALAALETLADLSLTMPDSPVESESVHLKEENITLDNNAYKATAHQSYQRDKQKLMEAKEKVAKEISGDAVLASVKYERGMDSVIHVNAFSEAKQQPESNNKQLKRKGKSLASKALDGEENDAVVKGKHPGQIAALSKQLKSSRLLEPSSDIDQKSATCDLAGSTASNVNLPTKQSRRKMHLKKTMSQQEMKSLENGLHNQSSKYSTNQQCSTHHIKKKVSCSLSSYKARRWCTFEWFYSAIDYPWFTKKEFVEYLDHVGLGHILRLSRVEWGVIRSSLGRPRRFSEHFLHEEREKLKQYRESVRKHYTEVRTGVREGLPQDLPRPLSVGQRVIALHPKTREVNNGSVLTVDHEKCMVRFDQPELGVEFVMDIDCMPSDPLENMPESIRRQNSAVGRLHLNSEGHNASHLGNAHLPMNSLIEQAKEALLMELRHANDDLFGKKDDFLKDSESFKNNAMVSSTMLYSKQSDTYLGNILPPWLKTSSISSGRLMHPTFLAKTSSTSLEPGFSVEEIVTGARAKAHKMVHTAMKAISSISDEEDAFTRIGDALDSMHTLQLSSDSGKSVLRLLDPVNGYCKSDSLLSSHASGPTLSHDSGKKEVSTMSQLISSCVATLLMIQTCTEQQYPPSDVAQILDSAITSLHPGCPQNLPIYRDIEMCMGRIKTQILALVPTFN